MSVDSQLYHTCNGKEALLRNFENNVSNLGNQIIIQIGKI